MKRLGILLSGRGSNFLAIHRAIQDGRLPDTGIAVVLSNKSAAPGLQAARDLGIPAHHIPTAGLPPEERDLPYIAALREAEVDLVCLAGYMRLISPAFVDAFRDRILNVHPSLLPAFPGLESQTQALDFGAKIAGCTVPLRRREDGSRCHHPAEGRAGPGRRHPRVAVRAHPRRRTPGLP